MSESNDELLSKYLKELINNCNISRNELRTCLETLITIYKNLHKNINELKFRKIRVKNKTFYNSVWKHISAKKLLLSGGWVEDVEQVDQLCHEIIVLDLMKYNPNCLHLLIANRDVKPDSNEWVDKNKVLIIDSNKLREQELRRKAINERLNDLEKFERQKRENQLLAQNIKKEIQSDNKHRRMIHNNNNEDNDINSLVNPFSKLSH